MDHAKNLDVVMPMYNLTDNYSKTSGSLCQYHRDEPALHNVCVIADFPDDNDCA